MQAEELKHIILRDLKSKLETARALTIYAGNRMKFNNWLKVEICGLAGERIGGFHVEPGFAQTVKVAVSEQHKETNAAEPDKIAVKLKKAKFDIRAGNWLIQTNTITTNYKHDGVRSDKIVSSGLKKLKKSIDKLKENKGDKKAAIVFVIFPVAEDNLADWQGEKSRLEKRVGSIIHETAFKFPGGISGRIGMGMIHYDFINNKIKSRYRRWHDGRKKSPAGS